VLLVAACGGGTHPAAAGTGSGQLTAQKMDAFARCTRGQQVPDFYFSRAGGSSAATSATPAICIRGWVAPADPGSPQIQAAEKTCHAGT
jgi:hypothetical protein